MDKKIVTVLEGNIVNPPPVWMMRQAGRHLPEYLEVRATTKNFIDFCLTPEKAAKVTLQPIDRYDMDGAILFADILLVPLALGRNVTFKKGIGPILDPLTISNISELDPVDTFKKLDPVYETVERVRRSLSENKTLIGFCGGPWTVATYMIEGRGSPAKEMAKRFAYNNPREMTDLLDILASVSADYLIAQARAGADVLKIFESWAEGLSPPMFEKLVLQPTRAIISQVRNAGVKVPIIGFPRGAGFNILPYVDMTGITAIAAGTDVPMKELRKKIPAKMAIQGNLDPLALRIGGTTLRLAVQSVLDDISGPHIFNLGHGVSPDVKIDNVHAVINHIRTGEGQYV